MQQFPLPQLLPFPSLVDHSQQQIAMISHNEREKALSWLHILSL